MLMPNEQQGYQGRVVGATDTHVRVELEAQQKIVSIKRELLDPGAPGAARPAHTGAPAAATGYVPPMTPMHAAGGRTPMHPGACGEKKWCRVIQGSLCISHVTSM